VSQHWHVPVRVGAAAAALAVATGTQACQAALVAQPVPVTATVRAEASWIRSAQLPDGAIAPEPGAGQILAYTANYAALGLARAAAELHDQADAEAAWRWLSWYQAHQDTAGFVTDYEVADGTETSTGTYDSTDAYAGTFLTAAAATWQSDPDKTRLRVLARGIGRAVAAIESTQTADGLTWPKPSYHVRLLMDNAEAYGGLRSAMTLAMALGERVLAVRAASDARRVAVGVASLWNHAAGGFDWATVPNGTASTTSWTVLYPDVMENAWAVAYGLASPVQATSIISHLDRQQPRWAEPDHAARSNIGGAVSQQPAGYWPVAGWALTLTGHTGDALDAAATISAGAAAERRTWPYTVADAGQLIALQSGWPSTAPWATPLPGSGRPPGRWSRPIIAALAAATILAGAALVWSRRFTLRQVMDGLRRRIGWRRC
jgi:hypothetical protein